jgi:hypothetical protein
MAGLRASKLVPCAAWVAVGIFSLHCGSGGLSKLEGSWTGDKVEGVPAPAESAALEYAKQTTLSFRGGMVTVSSPGLPKAEGGYKVVKEDKTRLVLAPAVASAASKTETLTLVDDKTIKWDMDDGMRIVLKKQAK